MSRASRMSSWCPSFSTLSLYRSSTVRLSSPWPDTSLFTKKCAYGRITSSRPGKFTEENKNKVYGKRAESRWLSKLIAEKVEWFFFCVAKIINFASMYRKWLCVFVCVGGTLGKRGKIERDWSEKHYGSTFSPSLYYREWGHEENEASAFVFSRYVKRLSVVFFVWG